MLKAIRRGWVASSGVFVVAVSALSVLLLTEHAALAAPSPEDAALATELFNQGRELMAAGKAEEACPKLAESHRLDPGGGTVLNLALCYEAIGKLASAYSALNEALALGRRDDRDDRISLATEHLAAVEPRLSRLVIQVAAETDVPGLSVTRDGSDVARAAWGSAMPVDGGTHEIAVTAPGRIPWKQVVQVQTENDTQTVVIPLLELEPTPPPAPPPSVAPAPLPVPVRSPPPEHDVSPGRTQRWAGFAVGGVGVVALGVGTYFGLRAISKKNESDELCKAGCTRRGSELSSEATTHADLSTASFVIGAIGVGLGTYLVLSEDVESGRQVGASLTPGAVSVRGRF